MCRVPPTPPSQNSTKQLPSSIKSKTASSNKERTDLAPNDKKQELLGRVTKFADFMLPKYEQVPVPGSKKEIVDAIVEAAIEIHAKFYGKDWDNFVSQFGTQRELETAFFCVVTGRQRKRDAQLFVQQNVIANLAPGDAIDSDLIEKATSQFMERYFSHVKRRQEKRLRAYARENIGEHLAEHLDDVLNFQYALNTVLDSDQDDNASHANPPRKRRRSEKDKKKKKKKKKKKSKKQKRSKRKETLDLAIANNT